MPVVVARSKRRYTSVHKRASITYVIAWPPTGPEPGTSSSSSGLIDSSGNELCPRFDKACMTNCDEFRTFMRMTESRSTETLQYRLIKQKCVINNQSPIDFQTNIRGSVDLPLRPNDYDTSEPHVFAMRVRQAFIFPGSHSSLFTVERVKQG